MVLMTTPVRIVVLFVLNVPMRRLALYANLRNSCRLMIPVWRNVQKVLLMRISSARIAHKAVLFAIRLITVLLVMKITS